MSIFNWFGKRPSQGAAPSQDSGLAQADTTIPNHLAAAATTGRGADAGQRRSARMERRELLYGVVRECMNAAGVLSASYKFKVLSLDTNGRQYLIMMDVPRAYVADPAQLSVIEGAIARGAKDRFDILVTAVYWRVNDLVGASQGARPVSLRMPQPGAPQRPAASPPVRPPSSAMAASAEGNAPKRAAAKGEVQEAELQAFKRAVADAARGSRAPAQGEVLRSGPRMAEPEPDFSDTQPFDNNAPLGPSQFGGLN